MFAKLQQNRFPKYFELFGVIYRPQNILEEAAALTTLKAEENELKTRSHLTQALDRYVLDL